MCLHFKHSTQILAKPKLETQSFPAACASCQTDVSSSSVCSAASFLNSSQQHPCPLPSFSAAASSDQTPLVAGTVVVVDAVANNSLPHILRRTPGQQVVRTVEPTHFDNHIAAVAGAGRSHTDRTRAVALLGSYIVAAAGGTLLPVVPVCTVTYRTAAGVHYFHPAYCHTRTAGCCTFSQYPCEIIYKD